MAHSTWAVLCSVLALTVLRCWCEHSKSDFKAVPQGILKKGANVIPEAEEGAKSGQGIEFCWKCNVHQSEARGVAFKVRRNSHTALRSKDDTLTFDEIVLDTHGSFQLDVSVFTAPVAGVYLFTLTVLSAPGKEARLRVLLNNETLLGQCYTGKDVQWSSGSETVVAILDSGDTVTVKGWDTYPSDIYGTGWTSFMGVRVS